MVSSTLHESLGLIARMPVLWIPGLYTGLLIAAGILAEYYAGTFLAGRLWIIGFVLLPLFVGGMLSAVKENTGDVRVFLRNGVRFYFRILLPGLVILFAGILTFALLTIPLLILGLPSASGLLIGLVAGVTVPFVFVTYFFDVVAVFEESPVFETVTAERGVCPHPFFPGIPVLHCQYRHCCGYCYRSCGSVDRSSVRTTPASHHDERHRDPTAHPGTIYRSLRDLGHLGDCRDSASRHDCSVHHPRDLQSLSVQEHSHDLPGHSGCSSAGRIRQQGPLVQILDTIFPRGPPRSTT